MRSLEVAVVTRDPEARLAAARAFDVAPASWTVSLHHERPDSADVVVLGPDVEGEGIRFDAESAASLVDEIMATTVRTGSVTVVSGVGRGVGCTTVGLHLSAEFARERDTCFVDLDTSFGAADRLGIDGEHLTWSDVDDSPESLQRASLPVQGGFRVLLAPTHAASPELPVDLLARVAGAFDRVVVDCPWDGPLGPALASAQAAVVVVPASAAGALRLERVVDRFERIPYALVAIRTGPGSDVNKMKFARVSGRSVAVELPCCGRLRDAEDEGRLFTSPFSRWRWSIARLARVLEQT
jgi:hypothetical protein